MNLNQLKYFVAVAEQQSFTRAANQYYLSQTAISQQVRSLEESIGVQLFDRDSRPVSLTPAGSVFFMEAKTILSRMDTALERVRDASTGLVGTLRVGYTKGYERSDLSNKLRAFHLEYPNVLITCYRCDTDVLAAGLLNGEFDVIFTWDSTNIRTEAVEVQLVERVPLVVALYGSHPFAQRTALHRTELKSETILYMSPSATGDSYGDSYFLALYRQAGYQPNILLRSNDVESILMMVAAEEGISILPAYCTAKLTNADNLVFVPLVGAEEAEEILAVWRKADETPPLRHFVSRL
ncbi:LysR family transcriptional regulator [Oscillibacter sp.]|uniref:LysR family transcriptional regulator n=1 Tax=Oscillibacter sp. TaxID=1945593 RepID=UPI00263825C6|nr:LysR family transcriptional regulator [Oscillibacter sp.]MDD3346139.1 LysR family transcriptional regulator [Oscillibacter sp.]